MNIKELRVPLLTAIAFVMFALSSAFTIDFRYAKAGDVTKAFEELAEVTNQRGSKLEEAIENNGIRSDINAKENRMLILNIQLIKADDPAEKHFMQTQIRELELQIQALREKIK